jgi:hypothetical protein
MGDLDLLKALQGSMYSPQEEMGGIGAQAIAAGIPALYNPYQNNTQNLGLSVGAGLLAGLLGGYGRYQAQTDNAALMPQIGSLLSAQPADRAGILASNPRLSPLVSALALQDYTDKADYRKAESLKGLDLKYAPQIEAAKFGATAPLELNQRFANGIADASLGQGKAILGGKEVDFKDIGLQTPQELAIAQELEKAKQLGPIETANAVSKATALSPVDAAAAGAKVTSEGKAKSDLMGYNPDKAAAEDKLRSEIKAIPSVSQFIDTQKALPLLETFSKQDTRSSDIGFVYNYIKAMDNNAVKEGEINLANTSNPYLKQMASELESAFTGKSKLTPELKAQMLGEIKQGQAAIYKQAKDDADLQIEIGKSRGITGNLYPFNPNLKFGDTGPDLTSATPITINGVPESKEAFIARLRGLGG